MKKGFSLLLIFSLLLASTACGGTSSDPTEGADSTTPADTEPTKIYDDDLPDKMDLGGYEFRVLVHENGNTADGAWAAFIDVEYETGETLNDAAYKRNLEVEERLNITISCIEKGTFGLLTQQVIYPAIMAQEDLYDFVVLQNDSVRLSPLLTDNCLLDLRTLDAINLNRTYYLQSANEVFNMKGKQYLVSGDYLCTLYSNSFIWTNMDKWEELKLEDPYQLVRDGKWTLDKCFSLVKDTWRDLNGNTTPDNDDFWGITGIPETLGYCFHSGGGTLLDTSGDEPEFTVASERNVDILERLVEELKNPDACFTYSNSQVYREPFFNGNSLMFFSGSSIKLLRDATFHTGILPFPKYDEEQENYYTILAGALGGIPVTVSDPERTATIVEALFSASSRYMEDAFIATYVEQKVLQDDESAEMFQLIRSSGRHNLADFVDPESLLGGYEFRVLIYENGNTADPDWSGYIDIETETGEKLNDAAYQRNLEVEERLNVNISCIEKGGFQSVSTNALYPAVMAQEDLCDLAIFGGDALAAMPLISDGCLVDFNSIGAMDLDAPYYLQSVREVFDIGGTLPYISGDYLCLLYSHSYLFTNMDKWREMKLEDPYTLVREGKWTIDKCFSIVKNTWQDLNGNTTADPEDFWGITGNYFTLGYCFHSGGGTLAVSGDDGWEFPVASERNVDLLEKINAQFSNPDVNFDLEVGVGYRKPYFDGRSLMFFSGSSIRTIREAEFLTGVLPFPKYDEEQEGYISILNNALASVPVTVSDPERTGTVIEALFSASRRILRPAFFDTYVEQKILRDDDSVEMYSIILDSGRHNFTSYIDPSNLFGGYNLVYNLLAKKSADLTSAWESIREGVESSYQSFFAGLNS